MKPGQKAREKGEILASAPEILLTFNLKISMALIQGEECMLSHSWDQLFVTPWTVTARTVTCQAPLSREFFRQEYWRVAISDSRRSSQPRDRTCVSCVSCMTGRFSTATHPRKPRVPCVQISATPTYKLCDLCRSMYHLLSKSGHLRKWKRMLLMILQGQYNVWAFVS